MPTYRYKGFDNTGAEREGTVEAANGQEAAQIVAATGVRVRMVSEVKPSSPQPPASSRPAQPVPQSPQPPIQRPQRSSQQAPKPAPRTAPQPSPRPVPQPAPRSQGVPPGKQVINTPTAPDRTIVHTAEGSDKDRMFMFSQFAAALRAGIAPHDFLNTVSQQAKGIFRPSLQRMAGAAMEGTPMSSVMELYPDLYPTHVVNLTRAGEIGGFLPEAFDTISQQAEQAHKFRRWFAWVSFLLWNALLSIPGIFLVTRATLSAWDKTEATAGAGGTNESIGFLRDEIIHKFIWPIGPLTLGIYAILFVTYRLFLTRPSRPLRHQLGLRWPVFGERAKHENLTIFSWTLSKLASSGIPYANAWELAAKSAPNIVMSKRFVQAGKAMGGERPFSTAMQDARLFPAEYSGTMLTAEYTGDIPGAMEQLARSSRAEFDTAQNMVKVRSGCWGMLGCFVTSGIVAGVFFYMWYVELPAKVLKGLGD